MATQRPNAILPGIVETIIEPPHPNEPEKVQIAIEGADDLCLLESKHIPARGVRSVAPGGTGQVLPGKPLPPRGNVRARGKTENGLSYPD